MDRHPIPLSRLDGTTPADTMTTPWMIASLAGAFILLAVAGGLRTLL
jgi:hypothetical protein